MPPPPRREFLSSQAGRDFFTTFWCPYPGAVPLGGLGSFFRRLIAVTLTTRRYIDERTIRVTTNGGDNGNFAQDGFFMGQSLSNLYFWDILKPSLEHLANDVQTIRM